jgi:2OG-Fe(II) oxygenase superfamily
VTQPAAAATAADWPPFQSIDLAAAGLLPDGWQAAIETLADAPERQTIIHEPASAPHPGWSFDVLSGDIVRDRLGWLWTLYHGALREFASRSCATPLVASQRLRAAMTLNILRGGGATNDWHRDANAVSGVFYAVTSASGGALLFRDEAGRTARLAPRPGLFACFPGSVEHKVEPLPADGTRLAVAMVYHGRDDAQLQAFGQDIYTLDVQPCSALQ